MDVDLDKNALNTIHGERNYNKAICYWLGFLKGVLASKDVTSFELEPMILHSEELLSKFHDDDAAELLEDISQSWPDVGSEIKGVIENIIEYRSGEIDLNNNHNVFNMFFGFLKGVACDNVITTHEISELQNYLNAYPILLSDPRVQDVANVIKIAMSDGLISNEESNEICHWISRIVGDSYADTGLTSSEDLAMSEEYLYSVEALSLNEANVVITGEFRIPRRLVVKALTGSGAIVKSSVSKRTKYLVVAAVVSPHYTTPNAGTKLKAAYALRSSGEPLGLVHERALTELFKSLA